MEHMIFDTHAHYDSDAFDEDREQVLAGLADKGVGTVVNIGADFDELPATIALTEKYPFIYGALGVHPDNVGILSEEKLQWIREQFRTRDKLVAVGEIGLDYYWDKAARDVQKHWFCRQMDLARELKKPIIIHSREAAQDTFDIMHAENARDIGGIVHCFSYSEEIARDALNMGFFIGIGGVVTYKNGRKLKEVAAYVPLDRIVLETDCPYLTPVPFRGQRNDSGNLIYVVKELAAIKQISEEEVIAATEKNARQVYRMQ